MTRGATALSSSKVRRVGTAMASGFRSGVPAALLATALGTLALSPPARAASAQHIISVLNAQRTANRIPAGITETPAWSAACQAHDAYEHTNKAFGHEEIEGKPGYTAQGNLIARTSVLAQGISWGATDPYNNAPYHLFDLLNPRISTTGAADFSGFGCVEIELGTLRAAPSEPVAYSYPGNHRTGVPASQQARELPTSPAQTVGLGTKATGPNLFVYFDGPWSNGSRAQIASASLTSAHGSIDLRWLDNNTSNLLAPTGAILIPVKPLRPRTSYRVRVSGTVLGVAPGTSIEQALSSCEAPEPGGGVMCGTPAPSTCVEDFATQLSVCGLSRSWAVSDRFSFTTARK
jgi:hypothetical protein